MIAEGELREALRSMGQIARMDLALFDREGKALSAAFPLSEGDRKAALAFFLQDREAWTDGEGRFLSAVEIKGKPEMALLGRGGGEEPFTCLKLAAFWLASALKAERRRPDPGEFLRKLMLGRLEEEEISEGFLKLRLNREERCCLFLMEAEEEVLETLIPLYGGAGGGYLFSAGSGRLAYIRRLRGGENAEELEETGREVVDVINTECMENARLAVGEPCSLGELPRSFEETCLALKVGAVFFRDRRVLPCNRLGLGRLIYSLPKDLCRRFLKEVFSAAGPEDLNEEDLTTIRHFFANSLNISETARSLYIHRNTLVYRLDRIQKALELNIRNFDDAMALKMALMINDCVKQREETLHDRETF